MIRVKSVENADELDRFLSFPWKIYQKDPYWVPPYRSQLLKRLDLNRNPFFQYASRELFAAYQDGDLVGTIAAIINRQHNQQLGELTGFFGFYESINDCEVTAALIEAAAERLSKRGVEYIRGPVNGAPTDEVGVLIAGHNSRPAMWEGHTPPYYQFLLESQGFEKYDDIFAYEINYQQFGCSLEALPAKLLRVARRGSAYPNLVVRPTNKKNWSQDIGTIHSLYNSAFRTIEGHTDIGFEKFKQMANSIRPLMDMDFALIAMVDDVPVGFAVALPDINESLRHFNGVITHWQIVNFYLYLKRTRTVCFKLLGVLPEYRGCGIEALLIYEIVNRIVKKKYERLEISLASENNTAMTRIIQRMGGQIYRHYRIYERRIKE